MARLTDEVQGLREAVAARDTFLAVAAHELRNPVTPISVRVQVMKRLVGMQPVPVAMLVEQLEAVERSVHVFIKRATTLLDVTRITTGTLRLEIDPVDVIDIVQTVVGDVEVLVGDAHGGIELQATGPVTAYADKVAVEQIVENLVSNGIKYGRGTPVRVSVSSNDAHATICVSDQGPGISAADQARIFDRFERAASSADGANGFGIGLWLVRELSEAMGGAVAVTSHPDAGSTFRVTLPARPPGQRA